MPEPCQTKELRGKTFRCFFELTLQVIGGKWKPIILYHLALQPEAPVMRFGDLRRSIGEVTERMLTRQLRELEADGLIHREVYREVPPRVEYSLTELGCSLIPILLMLRQWGAAYERAMGSELVLEGEDHHKRELLALAERKFPAGSPMGELLRLLGEVG